MSAGTGAKLIRYARFLLWLLRDAFGRRPRLTVATVFCGWLATFVEVAALGVALYYAHLFAEDRGVSFGERSLSARESEPLLIAFGVAAALLMLTAAGLQYAGRLGRLALRRQYGDACTERVLGRLGEHPLEERAALVLARADSLLCGRAAYILVGALTAGLTAVAALVAMFIIEPALTAVLLMIGLLSAVSLSRISLRGARSSRAVEELSGSSRDELRQTLRRLGPPAAGHEQDLAEEEISLEVGPVGRRHLDAYMMRIRAIADSEFAANVVFSFVLAFILVSLGLMAMRGHGAWERAIIYLLGLRYLLVNGRGFVRALTSMNRFYPQISRYWDYVHGIRPSFVSAPIVPGALDDEDDD